MLSQEEGGRGWQQTRQRKDKSPTSKIYTTWAHILCDRNVFRSPRGRGNTAGSNAPGAFLITPPSGRVLAIPIFFFIFIFFLFGGHLPQTSGFRLAKQIVVASSAIQVRARILGGRYIFCTLGEGQQGRDLMPLGLFLFIYIFSFLLVTCPRPPFFTFAKQILDILTHIFIGRNMYNRSLLG